MISEQDKEKQSKERECFRQAVKIGFRKGNETAKIVKYLCGTEISRERNDKPDLVLLCSKDDDNLIQHIVGIEHFEVNQASKKKGETFISTGDEFENILDKIYKNGHDELEHIGDASDYSKKRLLKQSAKFADVIVSTGYDTVMTHLAYNIKKHLQKVPEYRKNLKAIAGGKPIELAFLIEIKTAFPRLFYNDAKGVTIINDGLLPICDDLVSKIENLGMEGIDYAILYFKSASLQEAKNVIALRTSNVMKQLNEQGINVFRYAGHDQLKTTPLDSINEYNARADEIIPILERAYHAKTQGIPFVTTAAVQCFLEVIGDYVNEFTEKDGKMKFTLKNGISCADVMRRFKTVRQKYGMER